MYALEQFPKSVKRFSDENCDQIQKLERFAERSEATTALEQVLKTVKRFLRGNMRKTQKLVPSHELGAWENALEGVAIPRHAGSLGLVAFFTATLFYGVAVGGHVPQVIKLTTSSFGFGVENIEINGQMMAQKTALKHVSEIDILETLALDGDTSMLGFDVSTAQEKLGSLPWVESVHVRKIYPDTVQINLVEREALALWQYQGQVSVIDRQGSVIVPYSADVDISLPLVVGRGGEREAADLLQVMEQFPQLKDRIRAYIRVADRRWDLLLENGIDIKLPEQNFSTRLAEMLEEEAQYGLLSRDVLSVDLRLDDRIILALSDNGVKQRMRRVEELEREAKARKAKAQKVGRV